MSNAQSKFGEVIDNQIELIKKINDDNVTKEIIMNITKQQEQFYSRELEKILVNKNKYLNKKVSHVSEIYALEKIIKLNKRRSNKYAVLRDEVLIKSYKILDLENIMIKNILYALDENNYEQLQSRMGDIFSNNQTKIYALGLDSYEELLKIEDNSRVIKQLHENIRDMYAILELTSDVIKYFSIFDKRMYTLNKYSEYKLIKPIIAINNIDFVRDINSVISNYGFTVTKLIMIMILVLFVYLIRTVFFNILESYIVKIKSLQIYSKDLLLSIRKLVEKLIIFINIELVIYVYNDFLTVDKVSIFFNIVYGFIFTLIIYKIANTIAKVKVAEIQQEDGKSIKFEVINVGIKIVNFSIWIMGILLILFLAGVNLTAVLSGLGIGGFAIALAAKDSLANFFGTLSILFSDVFSQGDWIEVDGVEGTVVEIGLRVTTLRTFDNALISIPNAAVANKDIRNWNRRSLGRRIKMSLGIKYDSKSEDIKKAIDELYEMLDKHPSIATANTDFKHKYNKDKLSIIRSKDDAAGVKKTLLVYLDEFGSSSINILIYCFSKTVKWSEWLEVKQDVMFKMMEILEKNNLEFAFPSMSLYHENNLDLLEKK